MPRFAVLAIACLAAGLCAGQAQAQTDAATQDAFAFCTVTDTGSTPAKVWASPVFAFSYRSSDAGAFQRLNTIAGEFLQQVNAMGGAGDKQCQLGPSRAEADTARESVKAIWDKRMYFIKIGDWREVAWVPAAWTPTAEPAQPAQVTRYFTCYAVQLNVPDRSDRSRAVASQVFAMPVPTSEPAAMYTQALAYTQEFKAIAATHGIIDESTQCTPFDTRAEAEKSLKDQRRMLDGFNQKYTELPWQPTTGAVKASEAVTAPPVPATPATTPRAPLPAASAATAEHAAQPKPQTEVVAPSDALYCTGFVMRSKPALMVRAPVQQQASASTTTEILTATLSRLLASVQQANPGKWFDLPAGTCYDNSPVFKGEKFCITNQYKHFGGLQQAAMFCNASREQIDARWKDMEKADGGHAQVVAWPAAH